jgi:hypothetical protein
MEITTAFLHSPGFFPVTYTSFKINMSFNLNSFNAYLYSYECVQSSPRASPFLFWLSVSSSSVIMYHHLHCLIYDLLLFWHNYHCSINLKRTVKNYFYLFHFEYLQFHWYLYVKFLKLCMCYGTQRFNYCVHMSLLLVPTLSQINSVNTLISYF